MTKTSFLDRLAWAYNLLKVDSCDSVMSQNGLLQKGSQHNCFIAEVLHERYWIRSINGYKPGLKTAKLLFRELVENRELGRCTAVMRPNNDGRPPYIFFIKLRGGTCHNVYFQMFTREILNQFIMNHYAPLQLQEMICGSLGISWLWSYIPEIKNH